MATLSPPSVPVTRPASVGLATSRHAVFSRCRQLFGLPIDLVREVLPGQPLAPVPRAQEQILGVLNLRGEILPVVVIDPWLGLPPIADDPALPILVLRRDDLLVGLRVDAIRSVLNVPPEEIQPHPAASSDAMLTGLWQPEGQSPITLIAGAALLDALCQSTASNL